MSTKDHPNNAPGLPMLFPAWLDRWQMKYMNPVVRRVARYLPTFAVVKHRGRKSGTPFEPPVSLRVTPRRRENGFGLPADADVFLGA